jgi:hypothetical protein
VEAAVLGAEVAGGAPGIGTPGSSEAVSETMAEVAELELVAEGLLEPVAGPPPSTGDGPGSGG